MSLEAFQEEIGDLLSEAMAEGRQEATICSQDASQLLADHHFIENVYTLALLANGSYESSPKSVGQYDVVESGDFHPRLSAYVIYCHRKTKVKILALRGTDSIRDDVYDCTYIFPLVPLVTGESVYHLINFHEIYAGVMRKFHSLRKKHLFSAVVGHSLGGYLASIVCSHSGLPGMAFQAPGVPSHFRGHNLHPNFKVISVTNDVIGNYENFWGRGHPFPTHFVSISHVPVSLAHSSSLKQKHSIELLIDHFKDTGFNNQSNHFT